MITGYEMEGFQKQLFKQCVAELKKSASDGGDINLGVIEQITAKGVYRYVYTAYYPTLYSRRYENGGLADNGNIITTTTASWNEIKVDAEDRTPVNGDGIVDADPYFYLSDLIEQGSHGRKWPDPDWPGARPYMAKSMTDGVKSGDGLIAKAVSRTLKGITWTLT